MISELLKVMSVDMKIPRFQSETEDAYIYRLCYSALGQWCLSVGRNKDGTNIGTSKHNQTIKRRAISHRISIAMFRKPDVWTAESGTWLTSAM